MDKPNYNRLFIDMDSFYASIEQQDNPSYAGKPLIVVPCKTDYTCAISASLEAKALHAAVRSLPEADRAIISLHLDGYDHADIADIIGLTDGNVRVKLHRIKKQLTNMLKD